MRKKNKWKVIVQAADGQSGEQIVEAHWDPAHALTEQSVGDAACLPLWYASRGTQYPQGMKFMPLSVEQITEEAVAA